MAGNFEGPIAFDADAVPVNYFDQDDGDDCFLQPSPKAATIEQTNSQVNTEQLQDASLTSPIPTSTREALDLGSPPMFPADSDDSEFSDLGKTSRQPSPIDKDTTPDADFSFEAKKINFVPPAPHPAVAFGIGGQLRIWFQKPTPVCVKNVVQEIGEKTESFKALQGPLLVNAQQLGEYLESAGLTAPPSFSTERVVARELLYHTFAALYSANVKPFEATVGQHLMNSLAAVATVTNTPSSGAEIASLFGEIDDAFKIDTFNEIENLLLLGNLPAAQTLALKLHSSSHALVLSLLPHPPSSSYPAIILFALSLPTSPLRSLYLRIARYSGQIFEDFRWREHLLLALLFPAERSALSQLSRYIEATIPEAANVCRLIIGEPPLAQFTSNTPPHRLLFCPRHVMNFEALRWCEIFEFIHHHHLHAPVPEFHVDLQLLKSVMACMLSDFGQSEKAFEYACSILQQSGIGPELLESLQWFQYRLQQYLLPSPQQPQLQQTYQEPYQDQYQVQHQQPQYHDHQQSHEVHQQPQYHDHQHSQHHEVHQHTPHEVPLQAAQEPQYQPQEPQYQLQEPQYQEEPLYHPPHPQHEAQHHPHPDPQPPLQPAPPSPQPQRPYNPYTRSPRSEALQPEIQQPPMQFHLQPPRHTLHGQELLQPHMLPAVPHDPRQLSRSPAYEPVMPEPSAPPLDPRLQEPATSPQLKPTDASQKKGGGGWFSGIKKLLAAPEAREANLDQDHTFYYDEKLGRYVGTWAEEPAAPPKPQEEAAPPPPPPPPKLLGGNALGRAPSGPRYALDASMMSMTQ